MKVMMDIAPVKSCLVEECVFNHAKKCGARAITVGNDELPRCETYFVSDTRAMHSHQGGIGACKSTSCRFNRDYACHADAITIEHISNLANCRNFDPLET